MQHERATIFGSHAEHYDQYRPSYPAAVIDLVVESQPATAIDVGCGTGIAAALVAARGVDVTGVEADRRMAALTEARGIPVVVAKLEDWPVEPCDLLYAAQAWHWIDPPGGAKVAAAAIRPGGVWSAFWNYEIDGPVTEARNSVYREFAPELAGVSAQDYDEALFATASESFAATGAFDALTVDRIDWTDNVSIDHAVQRFASHSSHRLLDPKVAAAADLALADALQTPSGLVDIEYSTSIFRAQHR